MRTLITTLAVALAVTLFLPSVSLGEPSAKAEVKIIDHDYSVTNNYNIDVRSLYAQLESALLSQVRQLSSRLSAPACEAKYPVNPETGEGLEAQEACLKEATEANIALAGTVQREGEEAKRVFDAADKTAGVARADAAKATRRTPMPRLKRLLGEERDDETYELNDLDLLRRIAELAKTP